MEKKRFITVTNDYDKPKQIVLTNNNYKAKQKFSISVDGINSISLHENGRSTLISHKGHNNSGYQVVESCVQIFKLIKASKPI